jgi:ribosomal protein S18 acetylase RimI-like enzyme
MAIASVKPGAGERVLHTLMSLAPDRMLTLEVASTNAKALALYEKNGFVPIKTLKKWYAVQ